MPSKNRRAAIADAIARLRRVAACLTDRPVIATGPRSPAQRPYFGFAPALEPAPLRTQERRRRLLLSMVHEYEVVASATAPTAFEVRTIGYRYRVLDSQQRAILAYHWHPASISPIRYLHPHLSGRLSPLELGPGEEPAPLGEMHLPTGYVTLADVVRLLITEFGIAPRRADWEATLAAERPFGRIEG